MTEWYRAGVNPEPSPWWPRGVGRLLAADSAILLRYYTVDLEVIGAWIRTGAPPPTPVGGRLPLGGHNVTTQVSPTGPGPARTTGTTPG